MDLNREILDKLEESAEAIEIAWSTLEAVYDAMSGEDAVPETYHGAIRGAAEKAYLAKENMMQLVADLNEECCD